jgi:Mg-chelatase subunit ChlD
LVINTGQRQLSVVDLATGRSVLVDASGVNKTLGVRFNLALTETPILAVHGYSAVAVYEFRGQRDPQLLGKVAIAPQVYHPALAEVDMDRLGTLAWTGRGDGVIAARGGRQEYSIFDYRPDDSPVLRKRLDFDSCTSGLDRYTGMEIDVVTLNGRIRTPEPSRTAPPPPSPTKTALPTSTPMEVTPSPTPMSTHTPTATATSRTSLTPRPVYLPIVLVEVCTPNRQRVDVALVVDASTTMRNDRTQVGRTKLSAAVEAASGFIDAMSMPRDQAAVVIFNEDAHVLQGLTGRRADVKQALREIPHRVRELTRIDLGIEAGHIELIGANRTPQNRPVMIVLTDGLSNPVPASVAVRKALDAQRDGITIFTIGLGTEDELNVPELREMASKPEYFFHAPDGEDLRAIYREIAAEIPCPAEEFWGSR